MVGDRLYFYCSGRGQGNVMSLATLRRDGFVSLDAGQEEGTLTTQPVRLRGRHAFVNVDTAGGTLQAVVLDRGGRVLLPLRRENSLPIRSIRVTQPLRWQGAGDLAALAGQAVRFRFHPSNGNLYAFRVGPDASGASHSYVAAGGPVLGGLTDTSGARSGGKGARIAGLACG